jgi:hypothetical protein
VEDKDAGTLSIQSDMNGRTVNVRNLEAAALGGTAHGAAVVSLDDFTKSTGNLGWNGLDAAQVSNFIPKAEGLGGTISGTANLAPTDNPRDIGPLRLVAKISSNDLRFKSIEIGDAALSSYFADGRFVLDQSTLHAAGGQIHFWARRTIHEGGIIASQIQMEFSDLDLDQLNRAFITNPRPMPGKLAGNFVLIGSLRVPERLFGEGVVRITDSNLTNMRAVDKAYDYMNADKKAARATGVGNLSLRLDNNTLVMDKAIYFNQGIQLRAQATVQEVWRAPDSPVNGVVVGTLRPLKDVKLPMFSDADRIMNALQQYVTPLRITGTLENYEVAPSNLAAVGDTMQKLIVGEAQQGRQR